MHAPIMAQHTTSMEIYTESSNTGKTPELYLHHATEFLKQSQSTTSLKFNHEQCEYLVKGLETAVKSARNCFDQQISVSMENWKFLIRLAMDVQSFIHECCKDEWIQAASMLSNAFEYVASLICRLELCTWRFTTRNEILLGTTLREVLSSISEAHDQRLTSLFKEVKATLNSESISHPGERQHDISLHERLEAALATNPILDQPGLAELSMCDQVNLLSKVHQVSLDPESKSSITERLLGKLKIAVANPIPDSDLAEFMSYINVDCKDLELGKESLGPKGSDEPVLKVMCPWGGGAQKTLTCIKDPEKNPEVSILATLSHPNILRFLCYAKEGDTCFIVLELMEKNLDDLIKERLSKITDETKQGPFSVDEAIDIILQIAEGMYYLYRKRVLHRDLKSSNILVNIKKCVEVDLEFVYAKVADFGLSKRKVKSKTCHHPSWNRGTTRWMAPELIKLQGDQTTSSTNDKEEHVPFKSDVYSFGMVCYEILTGDYPFVDDSPLKAKEKVLAGVRPLVPSHCPPSLVSMMKKCWRHEPQERPTFAEICTELRIMKGLLLIGRSL